MDRKTYLDSINADGIDHKRVTWQSDVKPAAAHRARSLRKVTTAMVMTGATYRDLAEVKVAAAESEKQSGALPWGEWEVYPHIITHKGKDYARLYVVDGTIDTTFFVDGVVVAREVFLDYLTPSQRDAGRPMGGTITVTLDNVKVVK